MEVERGRRWRAAGPSEEPKSPETGAQQAEPQAVQAIVVCDPDGYACLALAFYACPVPPSLLGVLGAEATSRSGRRTSHS